MLNQKLKEKGNNKTSPLARAGELPLIPERLYFTIGEVAALCAVKPHVLRYWEQEFTQLNPAKRRGNRRYYQRSEVLLVRRIRELLYENGYTIEGARSQLQDKENLDQSTHQVTVGIISETIQRLEQLMLELEPT